MLNNFRALPLAEVEVKTQRVREIELLLKYGNPKERVSYCWVLIMATGRKKSPICLYII